MAFEQRSLDDYIDVAQRIADFREKYPEGTLGAVKMDGLPFKIVQAMGWDKNGEQVMQTFIVVVASASRYPQDPSPGIGSAWEIFPGRTPYTRGSELQNAETSAWGRAIIAVGASDSKRGIASREEVRNRQAERDEPAYPKCDAVNVTGLRCGLPKWHTESAPGDPARLHGWEPGALPRNADGSLSRSRTSDAEKAAAGVMTDAEQRAHNKLERDTLGVDSGGKNLAADLKASLTRARDERVDAAVDDRWTSDAPSWLVGVDPPEDQPGSILPAQRSQIMAVYTALGITRRDDRLHDMNDVLETKDGFGVLLVSSTNQLSHQQAARLLENLHERHTGKMTRR